MLETLCLIHWNTKMQSQHDLFAATHRNESMEHALNYKMLHKSPFHMQHLSPFPITSIASSCMQLLPPCSYAPYPLWLAPCKHKCRPYIYIYIYMVCITTQDYNSTIAPFASIPNDVVISSLWSLWSRWDACLDPFQLSFLACMSLDCVCGIALELCRWWQL